MSYATVEDITQAFDPTQWDGTAAPLSATVTAWLETESRVLDGRIAHVVEVPVELLDSPHLYEVCTEIVALRVRARVFDVLYPARPNLTQSAGRQSDVWRKESENLVKGIQAGATADGVALGGRSPERPGAPVGSFGDDDSDPPPFTMGQEWS